MTLPIGVIAEETPWWDWDITAAVLEQLRIPIVDDAGAPFAVSGWSADVKIKTRPGGDVLHTWTSGDVQLAGTNVTLTVLPATSLGWRFVKGWYRVKIEHPTDATQVYRILQGRLTVAPD